MSEATASPVRALRGGGTWRILAALVAGLVLGALALGAGDGLREPAVQIGSTVGGMWLNALKMTVVPLIVALLVTGVARGAEAVRAGGVAGRSVLWFVAILTGSAMFGALAMPGLLSIFPLPEAAAASLRAGLAGMDDGATAAAVPTASDLLGSVIPSNVISAAASDQTLSLVVFSLLFALAVSQLETGKRRTLVALFDAIADAMLVLIGWVLWLAPIGVFALAFTVGAGAGAAVLGAVVHYVVLISLLGIGIVIAAYAIGILVARIPPKLFAKAMIGPQAVAISTQSSLASLPAMLAAARMIGIRERVIDITLPLSVALFRATGPAMNIGVAFYIAHWFGLEPTAMQIVAGVAVASVMSYSSVSLPGQISFVTSIAPIALAMGVPIGPLALLVAVENIPDIFRTLGNVAMDVAVTGAVGSSQTEEEAVEPVVLD